MQLEGLIFPLNIIDFRYAAVKSAIIIEPTYETAESYQSNESVMLGSKIIKIKATNIATEPTIVSFLFFTRLNTLRLRKIAKESNRNNSKGEIFTILIPNILTPI